MKKWRRAPLSTLRLYYRGQGTGLAVWLHDAQGNYIRTISDALERGPELVSERRSSRTKVWRALSQALLSDR